MLYILHCALHFTFHLSTAISKVLPHWKTRKNTKKLLVFGENDSRRLSIFLQNFIFWNFDHISITYNQINYRNVCFPKVIMILIMTAQVLFFDVFYFFIFFWCTLMLLSVFGEKQREHHHRAQHIRISLDAKFYAGYVVLIFWTKFDQKVYFASKAGEIDITIELSNRTIPTFILER